MIQNTIQYKRIIILCRPFLGISSLKLVCCIECMALVNKKGGPYTKQEQEKRREEVFKLHFEYGYSAVQIAKLLNINRNTINEDIKYWYSELHNDNQSSYTKDWLYKQFTRLELQRVRLRKELEEDISLKDRLQVEKFITNIELSISSLIVKIETSRKYMKI